MAQKFPRLFLLLLLALFLLNFFQSYFTELIYDESYYWYYAQDMAWGYFDHPPMVALLIKISGIFFEGELGVRIMSCLLGVGTYFLIWLILGRPKKNREIWLLFALLFSLPLLNAYGFLTLPDTPLLLFTALFLYSYQHFLKKPGLLISIVLGISMAALMYSKYHAVLVIIFVILSNWKLILDRYAWLAVIISLACYIPHIVWLYQYDFVTVKYHLFERPNHAYGFAEFTLGYFLNLIIVFGLMFVWAYWALFKSLTKKDLFTKALVYLSAGFILFFFLSSFDRRVQTQWIVVICIPMAILTYHFITQNGVKLKWVFRLAILSAAILLFARIGLVYEPLFPVIYETHGNKEWVNDLEQKSTGVPVVFENSYRRSSMYQFYSGKPAFSLNNVHFRLNQYSIDSSESRVQHQKVLYVTKYAKKGDVQFNSLKGTTFYGNFIDNFESFRKLNCSVNSETLDFQQDEILVKIYNPYSEKILFDKIRMHLAFLDEYKKPMKTVPLRISEKHRHPELLKAKDTSFVYYSLPKLLEGSNFGRFSISENGLAPGINSMSIKIKQ